MLLMGLLLIATGCSPSAPHLKASPSVAPSTPPAPPLASAAPAVIGQAALHDGPVRCIAVSTDGSLAASGGEDGKIHLLRLSDWKDLQVLAHPTAVTAVAFDARGQILTSVSGTQVFRWGVKDGKLMSQLDLASGRVILASDGQTVAVVADLRVTVWDTSSGRVLRATRLRSRQLQREVLAGVFSEDGASLILAGKEQRAGSGGPYAQTWVITFSVGAREEALIWGNEGSQMVGIAVTPDDRTWVMVTADERPAWHVYAHIDGDSGPTELESAARGRLRRVVLGPLGARVLLIDDEARLYAVPTTAVPETADSPQPRGAGAGIELGKGVEDAAFTPDGTRLVAAGNDGVVRMYAIGPPSAR